MGKISIDLSSLKAAGIYTLEVDNTQRSSESTNALRMIVGFNNKGPFNRPVLLEQDIDRLSIFGDVDTKLEHKGCFFNRMMRTLLTDGPIIALNLLTVDTKYNGLDQVNYAAMSLDAATPNPSIQMTVDKLGEYDYLAETLDNIIYGTVKGDNIPYVGATPFSSLYNRTRFWVPDKDLLMAAAARGLQTSDYTSSNGTYEYSNFLNFGNVGTDEFSLIVYKPASMNGYDVTAEAWYGGKDNIPFGWIRPYDYISDYFLSVVCVKGNWSNYPVYATDNVWGQYFDKKGILKDKINSFLSADGVTVLGSWTGIIIPNFTDKQGNNLSLEKKINAATERTGLLMSFNNDAANVLTYDYSGSMYDETDPDRGVWGIDIDGNQEIESGEGTAPYIIDMVGHGIFMEKDVDDTTWNAVDLNNIVINKDSSVEGQRTRKYRSPADMVRIKAVDGSIRVTLAENVTIDTSLGMFVNHDVMLAFDPSVDSSVYTDNNLLTFINPAYYTIAASGAIQTSQITLTNVEFDKPDIPSVGDNEVTAFIHYGDVYCKLNFVVTIDSALNISAIDSSNPLLYKAEKRPVSGNYYGLNFLSYNYIAEDNDDVDVSVYNAHYFNEVGLWDSSIPVDEDVKNMFIITDEDEWVDSNIKLNDYVRNITYYNEVGETVHYKLIPGLARIVKKQFIQWHNDDVTPYINYKGQKYYYNGEHGTAQNGNEGFYLMTASAPVLIEDGNVIHRQLPMSDDSISHSLRFIPMKGLALSSRHRPGYDASGNLGYEAGIKKIYKTLTDTGIYRGLMNKQMVDYRYIIDSMNGGIGMELGGKVYLSQVAKDRGKCTAILNMPSAKQFAISTNPYFCDTFTPGYETRPALNTKYIPDGGNTEMGTEAMFSLPNEDDGAKFTACFWPNLIYTENNITYSIPPAADVANVLNRKFTGVNDPYCICANQNGILSNKYLTGIEFDADLYDREYLEPFGVNTIIKDGNDIMIYGNQTAYQTIKSDFNKLHVRENLNTLEIECEKITKKYNFLYNTAAVRANLVAQLTPILQTAVTSGAIDSYEIVCDETNNTQEIIEQDVCIVDVIIVFNHGMEKIVQQFTVNRKSSTTTE